MGVVVALRARDPHAGRRFLEERFAALPADERTSAVEALREGLSPDDEALLTTALGDARAEVRRAAADMLARLDGSALACRVAERTRPLLANDGRHGLAVTLPAPQPGDPLDGIAGRPPKGVGERAWLLRTLVAHVRPERWTEWLGAEPGALVTRALGSDEARPILDGWIDATTRFGSRSWAAALLAAPGITRVVAGLDPVRVLDALPHSERADVVAHAARTVDTTMLASLVERCPRPWSRPLTAAVFDVLAASFDDDDRSRAFDDLVRAAARAAPPERADELAEWASDGEGVRPSLVAAIDTIRLRRRIHAAFAELGPVTDERDLR